MGLEERTRSFHGSLQDLGPGLLVSFTVAAAASFLGEHYTAPVMLFALLLGMAFHFLAVEGRCEAGIEFTSKRLLRLGVALLGVRVTLGQISELGLGPIVLVVICIAATIGSGLLLARFFGRGWAFGLLTGGAVAICGASAALAISASLPRSSKLESDTLFTVVAVTALSTLAMIAYPVLFRTLGFSDAESGMLIGVTIHDVAQVVGAGYAISPEAGDVATYLKLLRVALLPVVVVAVAAVSRARSGGGSGPAVPLFAAGFAVIVLVNSAGWIPLSVAGFVEQVSRWLLVAAIAALGMKTSLKSLFELGPGHVLIISLETVVLAVLAVGIGFLL